MDSLKFGGEPLYDISQHPGFEFIKGDIREDADIDKGLDGVDHVAHLAAIVGDPACSKFPDEAMEVNWNASVSLFEKAEKAGISRFVFASTCSNYGKMTDANSFVTEESELRPVSLYAELKVKFEDYILNKRKDTRMSATALRFSTVYGFSPRIRFDLTVNEFTRNVCMTGEQEIWGPQFWRPYCHVDDLARAVMLIIESPVEKVRSNVFNVGDTSENYSKRMLMEEIQKQIPDAKAIYVDKTEDPRDYRVNFSKIKSQLGFTITKRVPDGINEIIKMMRSGLITDPHSEKFRNI
jgi:nucleoside-diphosphate-sugar epimerase